MALYQDWSQGSSDLRLMLELRALPQQRSPANPGCKIWYVYGKYHARSKLKCSLCSRRNWARDGVLLQ